MVNIFILIIYTLVMIGASAFYLNKRYHLLGNETLGKIVKRNIPYLLLTCIVCVGLWILQIQYILRSDSIHLAVLLKWSTLFWGTFLLAKIDFHEKKIPNQIVATLLILRGCFLAYEVLTNLEYWSAAIIYPLLGAVIGGGMLFVAMLLSRNGIGMGDIKLFIAVGAYVGSTEILSTMFYIFLAAAIGGGLLLLSRKVKMKDTLPMAPFVCIGVAVEYLQLMIGG